MNKFRDVMVYECVTGLKAVGIFYGILGVVVAATYLLTYIGTGSIVRPYSAVLEAWSLIFLLIFGMVGFHEDFAMLLQNGFTRRTIFGSGLLLFVVVALLMAAVDTAVGQLLGAISPEYVSLFTVAYYGREIPLLSRAVLLFLLYLFVLCLGYYLSILGKRLGKRRSILLLLVTWGTLNFLLPGAILLLPDEMQRRLADGVFTLVGYGAPGAMQMVYPMLLLAVLALLCSCGGYALIRRLSLDR